MIPDPTGSGSDTLVRAGASALNGSHSLGDGQIQLKVGGASKFEGGLSIDTNFSPIHLAGHYLSDFFKICDSSHKVMRSQNFGLEAKSRLVVFVKWLQDRLKKGAEESVCEEDRTRNFSFRIRILPGGSFRIQIRNLSRNLSNFRIWNRSVNKAFSFLQKTNSLCS